MISCESRYIRDYDAVTKADLIVHQNPIPENMASVLTTAGIALALLTILQILRSLYTRYRHATQARRWGCQPAPSLPQPIWDPLGLNIVVTWGRALDRMLFTECLSDIFTAMSRQKQRHVTTIKYSLLGTSEIFTMDPRNIQAILATQFEDFEIGPNRIGNFMPLLGPGIVSAAIQR